MSSRASLFTLTALIAVSALSSGCYTMRADIPGTWRPAAPNEEVVVIGRVDQSTTHWFLLYGLLPSPPPSLYREPLLKAVEAAGGDGVANLILDTEFTATDVLIRTFSLGILSPRTYRVRADIVLLPGPPPAGKALLRRTTRRAVPPAPLSTSPPIVPPVPLVPSDGPVAPPPSERAPVPLDPDELPPPAPLGAP
jgi:hypothetical protein